MALKTITPAALAVDTASEDVVVGTANGQSCAANDTFSIPAGFNDDFILVIKGSGTGVLTVTKGVNPPSPRANKGNATASYANSEVHLMVLEKGRFVQADGTIIGSIASATCIVSAYRCPPGFLGVNLAILKESTVG